MPLYQLDDPNPTSTLDAALLYADRGWHVIPIKPRGKKPLTSHGLKDGTTNPDIIHGWWNRWPDANVGIVTGEVSGLFVVDVDPRHGGEEALAALEREHGKLPETLGCGTGGGGRHLYFAHPADQKRVKNSQSKLGQGLEVKGDGGYVVAPPSLHRSGRRYEWQASRAPQAAGVTAAPPWLHEGVYIDTQRYKQSMPLCAPLGELDVDKAIDAAIKRTAPRAAGVRNPAVFEFAREMRAIFDGCNPESLRPYVVRWHESAASFTSGEHDFDDTWADFKYALPRVKFMKGCGPMTEMMELADSSPLPRCAENYESERIRRLVKLCYVLQENAGDEAFFLTCRGVAEVLGVSPTRANAYLHMLCGDRIIERVMKGRPGKGSQFRWLGGAVGDGAAQLDQ